MSEQEKQCYELRREIAHTVIHRMTMWQWITKGKFWRKEYDECCEALSNA